MAMEPMWMWVDMYGTPITTAIPVDIRARRLEKYLKRRDEYRAKRGAPPIWVGTKVTFAARQYQLKEAPRGEMARRGKVIWIRVGIVAIRPRGIILRRMQNV